MEEKDGLKNALNEFAKMANKKIQEQSNLEKSVELEIKEKKQILKPIRNLFRRFKEYGIVVYHGKKYNKDILDENLPNEVFFDFFQDKAIKPFAPGIRLIVEHPCLIYINVSNKYQIGEYGLISTIVPDNYKDCPCIELIRNKHFKTVDDACMALAKFFAQNTLKITNSNLVESEKG